MITKQTPSRRVGSHRRSANTGGMGSHNSKELSRDINIGSTMVHTSNGADSVDKVDSVDSVGNHPQDPDDLLEATGNCLVNRNFQWPWLTTPFPDTLLPPVSNHVSMLKLDPFRIYDRETGEPIGTGISHSTGSSQVDTALPGVDTAHCIGTQSDFREIDLSTRSSTPTTIYKVQVKNNVSSPLIISDSKNKLKHSECDRKNRQIRECDRKNGQISVKTIVFLVTLITVTLVLLSTLVTLSSIRRELNRERMGNITQEKRLGKNYAVMSQKSDISGPVTSDRDTAATSATDTRGATPTTSATATRDVTPTSATTETIDNTATNTTTSTVPAPPPTQMLNTGQPPTAITDDASILPPTVPAPPPTQLPPTPTPRTTTRTSSDTTKKWYRWR